MFFRKSRIEPLPVTMSAVRMGERVLQIGIDDPAIVGVLASKVGLSGNAAVVVVSDTEAQRARSAAAGAGVLVDVHVTSLSSLPFESAMFDLVIVHGMRGLLSSLEPTARTQALRECHRVLRVGGRLMTIEAAPASGLKGMLSKSPESTYDVISVLESAGFRPARLLAEREGYKFAEGIKQS